MRTLNIDSGKLDGVVDELLLSIIENIFEVIKIISEEILPRLIKLKWQQQLCELSEPSKL